MRNRGYACIGLDRPKDIKNIGGVLRAASCYEAQMIVISELQQTTEVEHLAADTAKTYRHVPVMFGANLEDFLPYKCIPIAVEITEDAHLLPNYTHPSRAFYVFGPENGSIKKEILEWCRDIVYIPTKYCMNLAATVNVVLYDRLVKNEKI